MDEFDFNELTTPAFLPKTQVVFTNNISKTTPKATPLEVEWCDVELSLPNPSLKLSQIGAYWAIERVPNSPAYFIYAIIKTKPLPQDPRPAAKFSIRLSADGTDNGLAFNGLVECTDYAYVDEEYRVRLYGDTNLRCDLLSDEQIYAEISRGYKGQNEATSPEIATLSIDTAKLVAGLSTNKKTIDGWNLSTFNAATRPISVSWSANSLDSSGNPYIVFNQYTGEFYAQSSVTASSVKQPFVATLSDNLNGNVIGEISFNKTIINATETAAFSYSGSVEKNNGEPLYTLKCKKTGFICIRCWKSASPEPSDHCYKIVQILPPKLKKTHTPFISKVAYALMPNEAVEIVCANDENKLKVQSMDENIVKITNLNNGFVKSNTTKTLGVSEGETLLKWSIAETATHKAVEFYTPIKVILSADGLDGTGGYNGSAVGGNTNFSNQSSYPALLKKDDTITLTAQDNNANAGISAYPKVLNLTPDILELTPNSETAKNCSYTLAAKGNGVGVVALYADDVNGYLAAGTTLTNRQKMIYQILVFDTRKVFNQILCGDGDKNAQGIYEEIEVNKIYDFH